MVTIHILHDNTLTADNRDKFNLLAGRYGQLVKFYNVDTLCAEDIRGLYRDMPSVATNRHTIATLYRFLIIKLIPPEVEKIIYLDADIIVNLNIAELWQVELGDKILGIVPEIANHKTRAAMRNIHRTCRDGLIKEDDYFNAGVLLVNLNALRKEIDTLSAGIKFIGQNPQYILLDQDVLNYSFSTRTVKLSAKFNQFVYRARLEGEFPPAKKIYHYVSRILALNTDDPYNRLWMHYFVKTPWFDEAAIGRLYAGFQQIHVGLKNSLINLSAAMSGKTRAFFVMPKDLDGIKRLFAIRDDEKIVLAENQESIQTLLDAMKKARSRRLFFIMVHNFPYQVLTAAGFVPNRDFVNGMEFLSELQGVTFNSHELIKAM